MFRAFMLAAALVSSATHCVAVEPIPASSIASYEELYVPGSFILSWNDQNRDAYFDVERFDGSGWSRATPWPMQQCTWCNGLQSGLYRIRSQSIYDEFDVSYSPSVWVPFEIWWFP